MKPAQAARPFILRSASLAMAGFLVRPLSRVPMLFIIAHMYGSAAFGQFVFAVALFEAAAAVARLGFRDTLFRFLAESPERPENVLADVLAATGGLAVLAALGLKSGLLTAYAVAQVTSLAIAGLGAVNRLPSSRRKQSLLSFSHGT